MKKLLLFLCISVFFNAQTNPYWGTSGTSISSGNWLGTKNSQPLIFKVNNSEVLRLTSSGAIKTNILNASVLATDSSGNIIAGTGGGSGGTQTLSYSNGSLSISGGNSVSIFDGNYNNLTNKPTLATVATSGSYNDLTSKPTIPSQYTDALARSASWILGDIKTGIQSADHNGWVKLDGRAKSTLTTTQQAAATSLGIGTNLPNATNSQLTQNGNPLGVVSGNNDKIILQNQLPNVRLAIVSQSTPAISQNLTSTNQTLSDFAHGSHPNHYDFVGSSTFEPDAGRTSSLNGGVTQQAFDVRGQELSVNVFIYLGN